jgi:hypothetical protein
MFKFVQSSFGRSTFAVHDPEVQWLTKLMWVQIGSDLFIGLACLAIALALFYFSPAGASFLFKHRCSNTPHPISSRS